MASKKTLNAKNLEALGTERLAQLLIEISTGDAAAKRKLRLELAGAQSPNEAGRAIVKRLTSIASAKGAITWKKRKGFIDDLQTQRRGIIEQVGPHDPDVGGLGREAASSSPGSDVLQRGRQTCPAAFVQFGSGSRSRAQRRRSKAVDRS